MDKYGARASKPATQQSAKRTGGVSGFARRQASPAQRSFAVFDIDGTLIRWQLYHAIADELAKKGHIDPRTHQKIKDSRMVWKNRVHGEAFDAYQGELVRLYEKLLLDLSVKKFNEAVESVFDEYKDQVYTYTRELIKQLKKDGYLLFAISGSQIEIVSKIAKYYGFDECVGSIYKHEGNKFTGAVTLHLGGKHLILQDLVNKHRATMTGSTAVGDSASDISMLEMVDSPVAFNPERKLFDVARSKGWRIVVERKNMVYELENSDGRYILAKTN